MFNSQIKETKRHLVDKSEKRKKKLAEYWRKRRGNLKSNLEDYKAHREKDTERIKRFRKERQSDESKQRNRELQRKRQKRYREKNKIYVQELDKNTKKPTTEEQRQKWKERKQLQRKNMTSEKKTAINEKRRKEYKKKKKLDNQSMNETATSNFDKKRDISKTKENNHKQDKEPIIKSSQTLVKIEIAISSPNTSTKRKHVMGKSEYQYKKDQDVPKKKVRNVNVAGQKDTLKPTELDQYCSRPSILTKEENKITSDREKGESIEISSQIFNASEDSYHKASDGKSQNSRYSPLSSVCTTSVNSASPSFSLVKQPQLKKAFTPEDIRNAFKPLLKHLANQKESMSLMQVEKHDFFNISKKPIDLSTVREKLKFRQYTDPWQFCDDVRLIFENERLRNRRGSLVYKNCSKLSDIFELKIDEIMQSLGYCCGKKYVFDPRVLCCDGKRSCTIPLDGIYYKYQKKNEQNGSFSGLHSKKNFCYCETCFEDIQGDNVEWSDNSLLNDIKISKKQFSKRKNDQLINELFVECDHCGRQMHQICVLHLETIWPNGFTCENCHRTEETKRKDNIYTVKNLVCSGIPNTKLGMHLEKRVNNYLKNKDAGAGNVTIKVLSSGYKVVEVKHGMKARFCANNEYPESFKYKAKAIFAFEDIDGTYVCFFGMHVQEYGSDCPQPNNRRVYISYLDSVHFFQPREFKTAVYQEILIGYLEYVKQQGYLFAHIWACPPSKGDDYIFNCHPPEQKIPDINRLQKWYIKMLCKAKEERCVMDYRDILKDTKERNVTRATQIPYFDGDYWPNVFEDSIKELDEEKEKKKCDNLKTELVQQGVEKRKKGGENEQKNPKKNSSLYGNNDLIQKIFTAMQKHRRVFFVIILNSQTDASQPLPPIIDSDPLISCNLMDDRNAFLSMAKDNHHEFSSLRRAKYSTLAMLYEIHINGRNNSLLTCNNCKTRVEALWHCTVCKDFYLCITCFQMETHPHPLVQLSFNLKDETSTREQDSNQNSSRQLIEKSINSLAHAFKCSDADCSRNHCIEMKLDHIHTVSCRSTDRSACPIWKKYIAVCLYHANHCIQNNCEVPFCEQIKKEMSSNNFSIGSYKQNVAKACYDVTELLM